jgi:hypothetical protein
MKMPFNKWTSIFLAIVAGAASIIGFMVKLPSVFRHIDKELHALFYFAAAAFLNMLFAKKKIGRHLLIFGILYFFGVCIEYAQAYSNKFFHKRIHGRFDPEDVAANLNGLLAFSILWLLYVSGSFVYRKMTVQEATQKIDG